MTEGADRVAGQLHGDKECPFSGVTKSGRVWRKVPESGARSVERSVTVICLFSKQRKALISRTRLAFRVAPLESSATRV